MTIDELRSAAAVVCDATEEGENTAQRVGQLILDTVNTLDAADTATREAANAATAAVSGKANSSDVYTKLQVDALIEAEASRASAEVDELEERVDDTLGMLSQWELCGLYQSTNEVLGLLVDVDEDVTVAGTQSAANVKVFYYSPCKSGEKFRVRCTEATNLTVYCSESEPNAEGMALGDKLFAVELLDADTWREVTAPRDGWIVFVRYKRSGFVRSERFVDQTPLFTLIGENVEVPLEAAVYGININSADADFGGVSDYHSSNVRHSGYVDIGDAEYISTLAIYSGIGAFLKRFLGSVFYDANYAAIAGSGFNPIALNSEAVSGMTTVKVPTGAKYVRVTCLSSIPAVLRKYRASVSVASPKRITELNPDTEMLPKLSALQEYNYDAPTVAQRRYGFVMSHISDVHAGHEQWDRYLEFYRYWKEKGRINIAIDTGDCVLGTYGDPITWRTKGEEVLTVIGNHDTRATAAEAVGLTTLALWQYHSVLSVEPNNKKDAYNRYIAPYVNAWDVVQPIDAADNGLCYYHKDFDDYKLRLVFVDIMGYDSAQAAWLTAVLEGARTHMSNDATDPYHVAIIAHHCGSASLCLPCNYSSLFEEPQGASLRISDYNTDIGGMVDIVKAFQTAGGEFVGYFVGHSHRDRVAKVADKGGVSYNQLVFTVSNGGKNSSNAGKSRDWRMIEGTKTWDSFQLVGIDTYTKVVKLAKVGADMDFYMRKKGTVCVSYDKARIANGTALIGSESAEPARYGATSARPTDLLTLLDVGYCYFDTTLGKPVYMVLKYVAVSGASKAAPNGSRTKVATPAQLVAGTLYELRNSRSAAPAVIKVGFGSEEAVNAAVAAETAEEIAAAEANLLIVYENIDNVLSAFVSGISAEAYPYMYLRNDATSNATISWWTVEKSWVDANGDVVQ